MNYRSVNAFTGEVVREFPLDSFPDLSLLQKSFSAWKNLAIEERILFFEKLKSKMDAQQDELAGLISLEMGKPVKESRAEISKTSGTMQYYIENAANFLKNLPVDIPSSSCYVTYEPLGIIFAIMPWNFPFWQLFRFAIPTMLAGNVVLLKHSSNVPQCAVAIERLFKESGFPDNTFRNCFIDTDTAARLLSDPQIAALSFTGSNATGSHLAELAGKSLKKVVMELGGNDAFIILEDADIPAAISLAVKSRTINSGQACNGAKRFIPVKKIAVEFTNGLVEAVKKLRVGDPFAPEINIGPLARPDLAEKVRKQIQDTVAKGAVAHEGMNPPPSGNNFVRPVVLTGVVPGMIAFEEEIFGPVWSVVEAKDEADAIRLANQSVFGLGASLCTGSVENALRIIPQLECGNVFVNDYVRSDPHLPFGGVKGSGFGRELGEDGIREFVNIKSVFIH